MPSGDEAGGTSKDRVVDLIRDIIDHEDKSKPLSDEKIMQQLKEHSIDINRRTVAKYRSQLNIPGMGKRKER